MTSITRIMRRVSRKTRGVPLEHILGAVVFLIVGGFGSWALWSAVDGAFVSYRADKAMQASVRGRDKEAVELVGKLVCGKAFQEAWAQRAEQFGLAGARRLEFLDPRSDGRFVLSCRGKPLWAVRASLNAACDRLAESRDSSLEMRAPGYEETRKKLDAEIAALQDRIDKARIDERPAGEWDALNALAAKLRAANDERQEAKRRREAAGNEAKLEAQIRDLGKELGAAPRAQIPPAERARLSAERERLQRLMARVDREDCTENHPLVRRLAQIDAELRAASLPERIAALRAELAEVQRLQKLLSEKEAAHRELQAKHDEEKARLEKITAQSDKVKGEHDQLVIQQQARQGELTALEGQPRYAVEIMVPAANPAVRSSGVWLCWVGLLAGLAAGAFLGLTAYRYAALRLSVIDDEGVLADKLHVPVLGSVPRMAALVRH